MLAMRYLLIRNPVTHSSLIRNLITTYRGGSFATTVWRGCYYVASPLVCFT